MKIMTLTLIALVALGTDFARAAGRSEKARGAGSYDEMLSWGNANICVGRIDSPLPVMEGIAREGDRYVLRFHDASGRKDVGLTLYLGMPRLQKGIAYLEDLDGVAKMAFIAKRSERFGVVSSDPANDRSYGLRRFRFEDLTTGWYHVALWSSSQEEAKCLRSGGCPPVYFSSAHAVCQFGDEPRCFQACHGQHAALIGSPPAQKHSIARK